VPAPAKGPTSRQWEGFYRWTAHRPPRELLLQLLNHVAWEPRRRGRRTAVDLGCGAGTDSLELLRRGWNVLAIDGEPASSRFLSRRVPPKLRDSLTCLIAPMEGLVVPPADLVYASFSLPFCAPDRFPALWSSLRRAIRPGGHFAGQLFGVGDEWHESGRALSFHSARQVRELARGFEVELWRETVEEGMSYGGPKHWHYFDLILGKPPRSSHRRRAPPGR